jgi:hypothetical protein
MKPAGRNPCGLGCIWAAFSHIAVPLGISAIGSLCYRVLRNWTGWGAFAKGSPRCGLTGLFGVGCIAQLVEQLTLNQRVVGSIPTAPTNPIKDLDHLLEATPKLSGNECGKEARHV